MWRSKDLEGKPLKINLDGIHDNIEEVKEIERQVREQDGSIDSII